MARIKWDELLPSSVTGSPSRSDVVQQLARIASAGSGDSSLNTGSSGVLSDPMQSTQPVAEQISSLITQMTNLVSLQQTQMGTVQVNSPTLTQNTSSGGLSAGSTAGSIASAVLGGGSILSPIIGGLLDLFGDSSQPAVAPTPFLLPAPVQYQGGITGSSPGQVAPVSYGEAGQPRGQAATSAPQVNIQISAMDSQSFLDHSDDIASAVKEALLNSHSLGDVISDL